MSHSRNGDERILNEPGGEGRTSTAGDRSQAQEALSDPPLASAADIECLSFVLDAEPSTEVLPTTLAKKKRKYADIDRQTSLDQDSTYKPFRETPDPVFGDLGYKSDVAKRLNKQARLFTDIVAETPQERAVKSLVIERLTLDVKYVYPDATLTPFGSYANNLAVPTSDIDIVMQDPTKSGAKGKTPLYKLSQKVRSDPSYGAHNFIRHARVPVLKFTESIAGINIDLIFDDRIQGVEHTKSMLAKYPAARPLILMAKVVLKNHRLGTSRILKLEKNFSVDDPAVGGMGSWCLLGLVTTFLELHPKLYDGTLDSTDLGVLLLEFMQFFGSFDFVNYGLRTVPPSAIYKKEQPSMNFTVTDFADVALLRAKTMVKANSVQRAFHQTYLGLIQACKSNFASSTIGNPLADAIAITTSVLTAKKRMLEVYNKGLLQDVLAGRIPTPHFVEQRSLHESENDLRSRKNSRPPKHQPNQQPERPQPRQIFKRGRSSYKRRRQE